MTGRTTEVVSYVKVLDDGRILRVPVGRSKAVARRLADEIALLVPPWSLDYCWIPGRNHTVAMTLAEIHRSLRPLWLTMDIVEFFSSVDQARMWRRLAEHGDRQLAARVRRFVEAMGCEHGLPTGAAFSPACANLYLAALDLRWKDNGVRVGDNIACADPGRMASELHDIGLRVRLTDELCSSAVVPDGCTCEVDTVS